MRSTGPCVDAVQASDAGISWFFKQWYDQGGVSTWTLTWTQRIDGAQPAVELVPTREIQAHDKDSQTPGSSTRLPAPTDTDVDMLW